MSHDRLEDLGRLAAILEIILEHEIFNEDRMLFSDYEKCMEKLSEERRKEIIDRVFNALPYLENKMIEALVIAQGSYKLYNPNHHG